MKLRALYEALAMNTSRSGSRANADVEEGGPAGPRAESGADGFVATLPSDPRDPRKRRSTSGTPTHLDPPRRIPPCHERPEPLGTHEFEEFEMRPHVDRRPALVTPTRARPIQDRKS